MNNKKSWIVALFLMVMCVVSCSGGHAENIEEVKQARAALTLPEEPDSAQMETIVHSARIWGFVKYHHPAFSSDTISADAEFFELLNRVLQVPDSLRNGIFSEWIAGLGPFTARKDKSDETLKVFNDFRWAADTLTWGTSLSRTLQKLKEAGCKDNNYVEQTPVNISYLEPVYKDIPQDDVAYRLLGVAKFWNAIDAYSPNRNLTDRPWDEVLRDYTALAFNRSVDFSRLYSKMVCELCDTHVNTWYIPIFGGRFVPLLCRFAEDRLFVTDTCSLVANSFQVGDEILQIDSVRPIDRLRELTPYLSHSNQASLLRNGSYATLLTKKNEAQIIYRRKGEIHTARVQTVPGEKFTNRIYTYIYSPDKPKLEKVADGIGCIRITGLTCKDDIELRDFLSEYTNLIIDLRGYPAEYDVIHRLLPEYFFAESRKAVQVRLPQTDRPGTLRCRDLKTLQTADPNHLFKGNIVLLVNASTQSMAEYFTMYLQTIPGVTTIGSQTAGADGDVTGIQLPYSKFYLTGAGIYYPDGTNAQRHGVKIDKVVEPTVEGLMYGEDEQLKAAIDYLQKSKK